MLRVFDPSVVPGAKPAPFPGFIEPCHPTLRQTGASGGGWVHEIKFDGYGRLQHGVKGMFRRHRCASCRVIGCRACTPTRF